MHYWTASLGPVASRVVRLHGGTLDRLTPENYRSMPATTTDDSERTDMKTLEIDSDDIVTALRACLC